MIKNTVLRITRHINYLEIMGNMYKKVLGFEELGRFKDHKGFDGIMLGHKNSLYRFIFTSRVDSVSKHNPNINDLLPFYREDYSE